MQGIGILAFFSAKDLLYIFFILHAYIPTYFFDFTFLTHMINFILPGLGSIVYQIEVQQIFVFIVIVKNH